MASANIVPTAGVDGIVYSDGVTLTAEEAALGDASEVSSIIPVGEGQSVIAVVILLPNGIITGNSTFIFLQTDLGDGIWIDVAWCFFSSTQAPGTFVLVGGGAITNNAIELVRNSGSAPAVQANGSNNIPLGGRIRFTGFTVMTGGSSSAAGVSTSILATITYKILTP